MVNATDPDDLEGTSVDVVEAMLRKTYTRLGKREGKSHIVFDFCRRASRPPELIEIFLGRHALHRRFRAGGDPRQGRRRSSSCAHPVLHLDPESHRLLDEAAPVSVNESLLLVQIEPIDDRRARARRCSPRSTAR